MLQTLVCLGLSMAAQEERNPAAVEPLRWHADLALARAEAEATGAPLLVVFR